jgi:lipopolysaccharide cholinephosphotransferase
VDTQKQRITLDELKKIELNTLLEIDALCEKLGLRYSLCGGTLLGAIRHGGFIPWDDDIDIFMPRPDYNRLIEYCRTNETSFALLCNETNEKYGYLFAKAMAKNTVIHELNANPTNIDMGVYVDIFPIDGLADGYEESKKLFNKTRFKRELLVAKNWKRFFRSKTRAWYYEPIRFAFFLLSRFVSRKGLIRSIQRAYRSDAFDQREYAATVCGSYRLKEILPRSVYDAYTELEFEGHKFKALAAYDTYLSSIYGDYMQLPPEDKRVSHHVFEAYYKDEKEIG